MTKHIALAGVLSLVLVSAVAAAPMDVGSGTGAQGLPQFVHQARLRIQRGVRTGRITPAELSRLRAEMNAVRTQIQALRRAGTPPSAAERLQVRRALRKINRDIVAANHNRIRRQRVP